ncbi:hypothetical protein D9758_006648 [Tetrapyrgos nigripes]|uniref:Uncharacterized protein n=1 Tax=Tetrapyrgos nigripes TaxID=182062 RepID=A0A8H5LQN3_9AGAR|nr:hypothetical protein D9758_006648 [Tetrapyrgos nigripes]
MKFTGIFATILAATLAVSALPSPIMGENAKRMAAGLPPLAPVRLRRQVYDPAPSATPVKRQAGYPSAVPRAM